MVEIFEKQFIYLNVESKNGYDALLWCTSSQLDEERCSFSIEEIKK